MSHSIWISILVMFAVSYTIRVLPLTLIRRPIENQFLRSFLYYVPYITLAVMTFPAMIHATSSLTAGIAAFALGLVLTWKGMGTFGTAIVCCALVYVLQMFL